MTPLSNRQIRMWIAMCNSIERRMPGYICYVELCNEYNEEIKLITQSNYHLIKGQNNVH